MSIIGEHGDYPKSEYGQTKYPRYEFFKQVTDVFRQDGRAVPVFNDKHLSWNWKWAEETFLTGKSPYPIERTLLTTGLVEAGVRSLGSGQRRLDTPHLAIRYEAPQESTFWRS